MNIVRRANAQIRKGIGEHSSLRFRRAKEIDGAVLYDLDAADLPRDVCTIAGSTLQVLADAEEVANAVLAIVNARRRILYR